MTKLQIIEFAEIYEGLDNIIVLFCKDEDSIPRTVFVRNPPLTICIAVGESYVNVDQLRMELNDHLIGKPPRCNRMECACGGDKFGIFRYPCRNERLRVFEEAVIDAKIIRSRGFEIFEQNDRPFVQFTLNRSFYLAAAAKFLETAYVGDIDPTWAGVYDKCANGLDEFVLSKRVASFNWISVPDNSEKYVHYDDVVVEDMIGRETILKSLYVDIETIKKTVEEPYSCVKQREGEYVIGIISTTLVTSDGKKINKSFMFCPEGMEDEPDEETVFFDSERDMLMAFRQYILDQDVDLFLGYNSNLFDFPYMLRRAARLGLDTFRYFSRLPGEPVVFEEKITSSKQGGDRKQCNFSCPGRIFLDLYPACKKTYKFESYKLKNVAEELDLDVSKDDVDYDDIPAYFYGSKQKRKVLLDYCKKDVLLTVIIGQEKMDLIRRTVAMSRLVGVNAQQAQDRGNSYLLGMMLRREMKEDYLPSSARFDEVLRAAFASIPGFTDLWNKAIKGEKYPGAFVFEPKIGLWNCCVITVDFNSLYPSVMITFNICLSTQLNHFSKDDPNINISPPGYAYVKEHVKKGLLPTLVARLIDERTRVRKNAETEPDPSRRAMMDAEQNALKIAANSFYGLMGSLTSILSSISAAYSVTAYGRKYIQMTCDAITEDTAFFEKYGFQVERPGFVEKYGLEIVGGDTDSLFIALTKITDPAEALLIIGPEIQTWINKTSGILLGRLKMGLEDCSYPYYLLAKKHYVKINHAQDKKTGLWKAPKFKFSGIGNRSLNLYSREIMYDIFNLKFKENRPTEYIEAYITVMCSDLWAGKVPKKKLKYSKNLPREIDSYETDHAHIVAAKQMRDAMIEVSPGDRIEYFLCDISTSSKKKADLAVAATLMTDKHTLHLESYIKEIIDNLSKTVLTFISGNTTKEKQRRLNMLAHLDSHLHTTRNTMPAKQQAKKRGKTCDDIVLSVQNRDESVRAAMERINPMNQFRVQSASVSAKPNVYQKVEASKSLKNKARGMQTTLASFFS
jgi:DNA polymerase elongation subunit (family B)